MTQLDHILQRLDQLAEEVRELQARTPPEGKISLPHGKETGLQEISRQIRAYIASLDTPGDDKFILHCVLEGANSSLQVTWLNAIQEDDSYSTARYCLALANEHRIKILKKLANREQTAAQLAEHTGLEGGPLYHHIKELITARFVTQRERNCYQVTREGLDAILAVGALNRRNTWGNAEVWQKGEDHED